LPVGFFFAGSVGWVVGLTFAAGAEDSALPAGVAPVDAQPASRLALKSMANKMLLLGFIDDLHLTGLVAGVSCYIFLN